MVKAILKSLFKKKFSKIKDRLLKERIIKLLTKIKENPEIGKPMRFSRKGTREVYIAPFRLSYSHKKEKIIFLDLYHKNNQ